MPTCCASLLLARSRYAPHAPTLPQSWTKEQQAYIDSLKDESKWAGKPYSARYIGSLVGDFHRTLLYGERRRQAAQSACVRRGRER